MKYLFATLILFSMTGAKASELQEASVDAYSELQNTNLDESFGEPVGELAFKTSTKHHKAKLGTCWLSISVCMMPWKYNVTKATCRAEGSGVDSWTANGGVCELLY